MGEIFTPGFYYLALAFFQIMEEERAQCKIVCVRVCVNALCLTARRSRTRSSMFCTGYVLSAERGSDGSSPTRWVRDGGISCWPLVDLEPRAEGMVTAQR